ncbi:MAG: fimbrillin family protein [Mucinivorans sp.]
MKRILVLASSAALVLSGCNKVDRLKDGPLPAASTVSFSTYLGGTTKGQQKTDFKMGDQFFTFGVKTGDADFDVKNPAFTQYVFTGASPLDHGLTVTHMGLDGTTPIWEYNEVAPWDNQKATFFAVSPVPQGAQTYGVTLRPIANNVIPAIDFKVVGGYAVGATSSDVLAASEKIKEQADLMWSYSPNNVKTGGVIQMPFHHALSQLSFSVKAYHTAGILRVNSITLKKVMTKGALSLAHDESKKGAVDYLGGWNAATEPMEFAVNLLTEKVAAIDRFIPTVDLTEPVKINITDADEALMMIPQVLTGIGLEVKYSYSIDGEQWQNYESGTALDYELSKLSSHWNPNMRYNYCLNINPGKAIGFNADIEAWDPVNNTVDMEYRTFDAKATPHALTVADGSDAQFELKTGDKVSVEYIYTPAVTGGQEWMTYLGEAAGATAKTLTAANAVTVTDADAGKWKLLVEKNFYPNVRKAVVTINRAPYKKTINGKEVLFSAGVAKYIITQAAGAALTPATVFYGGQNGTVLTGLNGYTTVSYPNAWGTTAHAGITSACAANGERPFIRLRVSQARTSPDGAEGSVGSNGSKALETCATYFEEGMPAGKWRLPRLSEMKLLFNNQNTINRGIREPLNTMNNFTWCATLNNGPSTVFLYNLYTDVANTVSNTTTSTYYVRCVAEE